MRRAELPPTDERPIVRINPFNAGELLGLIPYLFGFRPSESFVVLLFDQHRLVLSTRVDLPSVADAARLANYGRVLAAEHDATGVIGVVFGADLDTGIELLDRWRAAWTRGEGGSGRRWFRRRPRDRCVVLDAIYADGQRWWSRGTALARAQLEGTPYDPRATGAAATAVLAGLGAFDSREELEALVAGPPESDRPGLAALTARVLRDLDPLDRAARQALIEEMIDTALDQATEVGSGPELDDETCVRLAVLAADIAVRDVAWSVISSDRADGHTALWTRVVRRTIDRYALGPLGLAGVAAWIGGNGALLNCCIDRAERLDPTYSMITLLAEINRRAIPPSAWHELGPAIRKGVVG